MGTDGENSPQSGWLRRIVIGRNPKVTLLRVVALIITCTVLFHFALLPIRVDGVSMAPTYPNHGVHFVNLLAYKFHDPKRGDVVAIRYTGIHLMLMKRVVGLPGETIAFHQGRLFINDQPIDEPYVKRPCDWETPPEKIEADEYYVVGDNRSMPEGDHVKGRAARDKIMGRVLL
jgi:signal peptidase I